MEVKIITSMPEPTARRGRGGRTSTYNFGELPINGGYKWAFPEDKEEAKKVERRVRGAVTSYHTSHPDWAYKTFTVGAEDTIEPAGAGICVKRIAAMPERKKATKKSGSETMTITPADVGTLSAESLAN